MAADRLGPVPMVLQDFHQRVGVDRMAVDQLADPRGAGTENGKTYGQLIGDSAAGIQAAEHVGVRNAAVLRLDALNIDRRKFQRYDITTVRPDREID